jgi:pimeloyl-ACP methyl ester carboxylesterase
MAEAREVVFSMALSSRFRSRGVLEMSVVSTLLLVGDAMGGMVAQRLALEHAIKIVSLVASGNASCPDPVDRLKIDLGRRVLQRIGAKPPAQIKSSTGQRTILPPDGARSVQPNAGKVFSIHIARHDHAGFALATEITQCMQCNASRL